MDSTTAKETDFLEQVYYNLFIYFNFLFNIKI